MGANDKVAATFHPDRMGWPVWARTDRYVMDTTADGIRIVRMPGGTKPVKWRADCVFCQHYTGTDFFPAHENVNPHCRGGGQPHCTCDYCF